MILPDCSHGYTEVQLLRKGDRQSRDKPQALWDASFITSEVEKSLLLGGPAESGQTSLPPHAALRKPRFGLSVLVVCKLLLAEAQFLWSPSCPGPRAPSCSSCAWLCATMATPWRGAWQGTGPRCSAPQEQTAWRSLGHSGLGASGAGGTIRTKEAVEMEPELTPWSLGLWVLNAWLFV